MIKVMDYLELFKFKYHISFPFVVLGAYFASDDFFSLAAALIIVYISFNVLMYGGLYTLNDIFDMESDRLHPRKRNRPLPSGRISVPCAYAFAITGVVSGLAIGYLCFGKLIFALYVLFVLANQFYTHIGKKIPYLEFAANAITYPMRFFLGIALVSNQAPYLFLIAIFLLACGMVAFRRTIEMGSGGWKARAVLRYYNIRTLILLQFFLFVLVSVSAYLDYPHFQWWYLSIIAFYLLSVSLVKFSKAALSFYRWLWSN